MTELAAIFILLVIAFICGYLFYLSRKNNQLQEQKIINFFNKKGIKVSIDESGLDVKREAKCYLFSWKNLNVQRIEGPIATSHKNLLTLIKIDIHQKKVPRVHIENLSDLEGLEGTRLKEFLKGCYRRLHHPITVEQNDSLLEITVHGKLVYKATDLYFLTYSLDQFLLD